MEEKKAKDGSAKVALTGMDHCLLVFVLAADWTAPQLVLHAVKSSTDPFDLNPA